MRDLIERQAAIDAISSMFAPTPTQKDMVEDCLEVIENLPSAQPEQRWIPCSERLPEKPEQVLIYAWNVHYVLAKYREIRTWEGIYKMAWVMEDAYNAPHEIKHDVIAWMPLPELYTERREE